MNNKALHNLQNCYIHRFASYKFYINLKLWFVMEASSMINIYQHPTVKSYQMSVLSSLILFPWEMS